MAKISLEVNSSELLKTILKEVRLLRREVTVFLPSEKLEDYAHPARIKKSYQEAVRKYPPSSVSLWR